MKIKFIFMTILYINFIYAETYKSITFPVFLKKENYFSDFKNHYSELENVCIGKVIFEKNEIQYFVCNKYFEKEKIFSSHLLSIEFKSYGIEKTNLPDGSFIVYKSRLHSPQKLKNENIYLVFTESRRDFFINIENAKEYIDFLANKNFPNVHPNPAHQVCFKKSDCISVKKSCTEQIAINKKYLIKYRVASTEKNLEKCNNEKEEINRPSCVENFCIINNK